MSTEEKLNIILNKLETLEQKIDKINIDTQKMSTHIEFINNMYEKYKHGLDLVQSIFSRCK